MGRLTNGINGPIIGEVGSVVGSSRNGVPYIKGPYKKRTNRISKKEKANRDKFAKAQAWLKPILSFVRVGFKGYTERSEGFVAAKSYLLKNAVEGETPDFTINPSLMKVSVGKLPLPKNISVGMTPDNKLQFSWDTDSKKPAHDLDQVMMLAYNTKDLYPIYISTGQFRKTGTDVLPMNDNQGKTFHIYIAFVARDRSMQSDSVYLGTIDT